MHENFDSLITATATANKKPQLNLLKLSCCLSQSKISVSKITPYFCSAVCVLDTKSSCNNKGKEITENTVMYHILPHIPQLQSWTVETPRGT